ncbi:aa3-type cytochrome c oxidase subunit IV [Puniceibacterium sp. IMCC21224]|nr:aa3-type cytochrome c oxidase subunit IV [Puniceibacterium sp. IMCC21224]KMK66583.1 Bacterial aa3 type cytochrome c oxidase subunit IV [Puniceibacterium sp. IMCC21224]
MADYKHGSMDISTQEKTFSGFISFTTKSVIAILVCVIFLAIVGG